MTVATFDQPNYTTDTNGTEYPLAIDACLAVLARKGGWFAPHENNFGSPGTPDMTVRLDAGYVFNGTTLTEVAAQSTAVITAPVSNPRIDRVVVDAATGAVSVIQGTEAASPSAPAITAGKLPIAKVALSVGQTSITNSNLTDERARITNPRAQGKESIWLPAGALKPRDTNGPSRGSVELSTNKVMLDTLDFDGVTEESAQFQNPMPKSWDGGTVSFIPFWTVADSGSPSPIIGGGVTWRLSGRALTDGESVDAAQGTKVDSDDQFQGANKLHVGPESSAITVAQGSPTLWPSLITWEISRNPADAQDNMQSHDAKLIGILVFYTTNKPTDD